MISFEMYGRKKSSHVPLHPRIPFAEAEKHDEEHSRDGSRGFPEQETAGLSQYDINLNYRLQ